MLKKEVAAAQADHQIATSDLNEAKRQRDFSEKESEKLKTESQSEIDRLVSTCHLSASTCHLSARLMLGTWLQASEDPGSIKDNGTGTVT